MKVRDTVFPVTLEAFCAIQEHFCGRTVDINEREIASMAVDIINGEFMNGQQGKDPLDTDAVLKSAIKHGWNNPVVLRFAKAMKAWCALAYERGAENRRKQHA